jgi:hypothetical protein
MKTIYKNKRDYYKAEVQRLTERVKELEARQVSSQIPGLEGEPPQCFLGPNRNHIEVADGLYFCCTQDYSQLAAQLLYGGRLREQLIAIRKIAVATHIEMLSKKLDNLES